MLLTWIAVSFLSRLCGGESNLTIEQSYNQGDLSIGELKAHSDITAKNKETVLGKQPDTAIQVNNNVSTISDKDEFRQVALEVLQMV